MEGDASGMPHVFLRLYPFTSTPTARQAGPQRRAEALRALAALLWALRATAAGAGAPAATAAALA